MLIETNNIVGSRFEVVELKSRLTCRWDDADNKTLLYTVKIYDEYTEKHITTVKYFPNYFLAKKYAISMCNTYECICIICKINDDLEEDNIAKVSENNITFF